MTIPQGYKQTELGIIPEDWEVKQISDFTSVVTGGTPSTQHAEYWGGDIRWMNSGELNLKFVYDVEGRITEEGLNNSSTHIIPAKCVLVGLAGQGKTRGTAAYNLVSLCTNQSIAAFLPTDTHSSLYLYYVIDSLYDYLRLLSSGDGGRGGLNKQILSLLNIVLPPIAEQRAIAEALSDVDGLIAALDKKIAKKRLLKQGAMCKLLSLSGRGKKWFNVRLGNVVNIRKGSMLTSDRFVAGNIPVIAGGKIPAGYHNVANRPANTITISASGASAGYVALYNKPIFATDCSTIEPCSTYDIHYIYHLLKYYQSEIFAMQTGGAQPHVHPSDLNELQILYAKDIEEQRAIATILSDMDKEIADLEAKRDKYRLLKSGMMQKLLTGQIRLK